MSALHGRPGRRHASARRPPGSPARLTACGVRSINNIVDITNYVLLETGHPIHAYDLARLAQTELRARRAAAGEPVKTLDGVTRTASADMLVIADAARAQGFGGIMGGGDSEVTDATTTIAVESAHFAPAPGAADGAAPRPVDRGLAPLRARRRLRRGGDGARPRPRAGRADRRRHGAPGWIDAQPRPPRRAAALTLRRARIARVLGYAVARRDGRAHPRRARLRPRPHARF